MAFNSKRHIWAPQEWGWGLARHPERQQPLSRTVLLCFFFIAHLLLYSSLCLLKVFGLDRLWLWTWPLSAPSPQPQGFHSKFLGKNSMAQCICLDTSLTIAAGRPQMTAGLNRALGSLPWMSVLPRQLAYAKLSETSVPSILSLSLLGWWLAHMVWDSSPPYPLGRSRMEGWPWNCTHHFHSQARIYPHD